MQERLRKQMETRSQREREKEKKSRKFKAKAYLDSWKAGIGKLGQRVTANSFSGIHEMVATPVAWPMSRI